MIRILAALVFMATAASAQIYPEVYSVTDVAASDRLNVRAAPDAGSEILGSYPPYAINIEVLQTSPDGAWGMVGWGERNGWVALRYLVATPPADPYALPRPLVCSGVEPFWSLGIYPRGDEYTDMDDGRRDLTLTEEAVAINGYAAHFVEGPTLERTLLVKRGQCSDTMSDRIYGWQAMLFSAAPDGNTLVSGCCTLDANTP